MSTCLQDKALKDPDLKFSGRRLFNICRHRRCRIQGQKLLNICQKKKASAKRKTRLQVLDILSKHTCSFCLHRANCVRFGGGGGGGVKCLSFGKPFLFLSFLSVIPHKSFGSASVSACLHVHNSPVL